MSNEGSLASYKRRETLVRIVPEGAEKHREIDPNLIKRLRNTGGVNIPDIKTVTRDKAYSRMKRSYSGVAPDGSKRNSHMGDIDFSRSRILEENSDWSSNGDTEQRLSARIRPHGDVNTNDFLSPRLNTIKIDTPQTVTRPMMMDNESEKRKEFSRLFSGMKKLLSKQNTEILESPDKEEDSSKGEQRKALGLLFKGLKKDKKDKDQSGDKGKDEEEKQKKMLGKLFRGFHKAFTTNIETVTQKKSSENALKSSELSLSKHKKLTASMKRLSMISDFNELSNEAELKVKSRRGGNPRDQEELTYTKGPIQKLEDAIKELEARVHRLDSKIDQESRAKMIVGEDIKAIEERLMHVNAGIEEKEKKLKEKDCLIREAKVSIDKITETTAKLVHTLKRNNDFTQF